jgi:hypothetical protein
LSPGAGSPKAQGRGDEGLIARLGSEAGLSREEAVYYLRLVREGSAPASGDESPREALARLGMAILSGDGKRVIPVHPRLGLANQYRAWRERMVREINDRRMRMDKLILELVPAYEAAMEKRAGDGGA